MGAGCGLRQPGLAASGAAAAGCARSERDCRWARQRKRSPSRAASKTATVLVRLDEERLEVSKTPEGRRRPFGALGALGLLVREAAPPPLHQAQRVEFGGGGQGDAAPRRRLGRGGIGYP